MYNLDPQDNWITVTVLSDKDDSPMISLSLSPLHLTSLQFSFIVQLFDEDLLPIKSIIFKGRNHIFLAYICILKDQSNTWHLVVVQLIIVK